MIHLWSSEFSLEKPMKIFNGSVNARVQLWPSRSMEEELQRHLDGDEANNP